MSYLVLARKWRPKNFQQVVGQEHVVRTLTHSLDNQRLHHAYLFTGTRGVGKTTLARILAKALNCQAGVSSVPCNECDACIQIDEGRFIDLIEVDAASNTKVEDTRALLDNVPFSSSSGRYKIYLIDEIHMLSTSSFNALLKTLEEPPEHVKFLMATTDPQKLPVTVLSRCIQFNLRALDHPEIQAQIEHILKHEEIAFEPAAASAIARQSKGSMRDSLSILDQAISFTQGHLQTEDVRRMLGMLSQDFLHTLIEVIAQQQADQITAIVDQMQERAVNFESALDDILLRLHDLALWKLAPETIASKDVDVDELRQLGESLSSEEIQLFYQIALIGKRDLGLAPEPRIGFEMILLRMLAFVPPGHTGAVRFQSPATPTRPPRETEPQAAAGGAAHESTTQGAPATSESSAVTAPSSPASAQPGQLENAEDWHAFATQAASLGGYARNLAQKAAFKTRSGNQITLTLQSDSITNLDRRDKTREDLEAALQDTFGERLKVVITDEDNENESTISRTDREQRLKRAQITRQIESEEIPQLLKSHFGATIEADSIQIRSEQSE